MSYFLVPRGAIIPFIEAHATLFAQLATPTHRADAHPVLLDALCEIAAWSSRDAKLSWPAIHALRARKRYAHCSLFFLRHNTIVQNVGRADAYRATPRRGWAEVPQARLVRIAARAAAARVQA